MQAAAQGFKERKGNKAQSACETFLLRFGVAVQMCRLEVAIPARSTMGNKVLQQMTL